MMHIRLRYLGECGASAVALAACSIPFASPASAQTAAPPASAQPAGPDTSSSDNDIVVTAERRSSTVQKTALAITAITGEDLARSQISDVQGLQYRTPGLVLGDNFGLSRLSIRGVSTENVLGGSIGGDPGVSYQLNGIVLGRPQAASSVLYDVQRVEVLRGPQGTLYGRNATGGSVNVITRQSRPGETDGFAEVTAGNLGRLKGTAAATIPLGTDAALRVAGFAERADGFITNEVASGDQDIGNKRHFGVRGTLAAILTPQVQVSAFVDYYRRNNAIGAYVVQPNVRGETDPQRMMGGSFATKERHVRFDFNESQDLADILTTGLEFNVDLGGVKLTSVSGYNESLTNNAFDLDGSSAAFVNTDYRRNSAWQLSQELRLASSDEGRFRWIIGGFYFKERARADQLFRLVSFALDFSSGGRVKVESIAAFGQAEFDLLPELTLTGGLRWTRDRKQGSEFFTFGTTTNRVLPDITYSALTPRLAVEYRPAPTILAYASVARGFKSGGYNIGALQDPYEPEFVWNYEAGLKTQWLDRRLTANLAVYHYKYTDQQVSQILGLIAVLTNAAASRATGVELELNYRPVRDLQLGLNYAWTDAKFAEFRTIEDPFPELGLQDLSGNRLPRSPRNTLNAFADTKLGEVSGFGISARAEGSYTSRVFFSEFNRDFGSQKAYALFNASLRADNGRLYGSVFVSNIGDVNVRNNSIITAQLVGYGNIINLGPPRTFGAQLGVRF